MKPFRKNLAIAVDGGGIRGVIVTRALSILERVLGQTVFELSRLMAGTSTGSIIVTALATGKSAPELHQLYLDYGEIIFKKSWRTFFWPLTRYRYPQKPLEQALRMYLGERVMSDYWTVDPPTDVIITTYDLLENRPRLIKSWKSEYEDWTAVKAVLASSSAPTYFPVVEGQFVDGGLGTFMNPCYLAAYEILFVLQWPLEETTLISLGTGRDPNAIQPGQPERVYSWQWLEPLFDAFVASASDQQVHLVDSLFNGLDFRRFQIDMQESIEMDDASAIPELVKYGEAMGQMILNDQYDRAQLIEPPDMP
jgi:predicted acylesterase/phospholipase RssA